MTDIDNVLKRKFYKYVFQFNGWGEVGIDDDYNENFQSAILFKMDTALIEEDEETYNRLFKDKGIEYFILEYWSGYEIQREFHVYENDNFRETNTEEDIYLRDVEDTYQIFYLDQKFLLSFNDEEWRDIKKKSEESFVKFNENVIKNFNDFNLLEFKEEDLEPTSSFETHDILNPDVWEDFKLKDDIRERLIEICNEFINTLYGDFEVKDIFLTGSLSSFNWSKYSDFDLHVQINYSDINDDEELVSNYLNLFGKRFNRDYNITLYGYDVEVYIENVGEDRSHVNGLYSLLNDRWVKKPKPNKVKEVDTELVERKAIDLMEQVDELESKMEKGNYNELQDEVDKIWDKIKKSRRDGIDSPDGDYSIGNLVFKYLRRNEYIGKVIEIKKTLVENKYSII